MRFSDSGEVYTLSVGLYSHEAGVLRVKGEKYMVSVLGEALINAYGEEEYRIVVVLPEMPNTRYIRITRGDADTMIFSFSELPSDRLVDMAIKKAKAKGALKLALDLLERAYGEDFIQRKIGEIFNPVLTGVRTTAEGYDGLISEMENDVAEESVTVRVLRAIVTRFFNEAYEEPEAEAPNIEEAEEEKSEGGFFSSILARLRGTRGE
jgi:hypothetical protein